MRDSAFTCSSHVSWWFSKPLLIRGRTEGTKSGLGGVQSPRHCSLLWLCLPNLCAQHSSNKLQR